MAGRIRLKEESIARLVQVADSLPDVWRELEQMGHRLPSVVLSELASLQISERGVRSPEAYLTEVAKERISLPYSFWSPATRPTGKGRTYRSKYLDFLEESLNCNKWPDLEPEREEVASSIDPAHIRYHALKIQDPDAWQTRLERYRAVLQEEGQSLPRDLLDLWPAGKSVSARKYVEVVQALSERYRFVPFGTGAQKEPPCFFVRELACDDVKIFLCLADARQLPKGLWSISVGFCSSSDRLHEPVHDRILLIDAINRYAPGGIHYLRHDGSAERAILGVVFAAALLDRLANRFDAPQVDGAAH